MTAAGHDVGKVHSLVHAAILKPIGRDGM
jgi:hypothetical protein